MKKSLAVLLLSVALAGCESSEAAIQKSESAEPAASAAASLPSQTTPSSIINTELHLSSSDLNDGIWNSIIADEGSGENKSPALSWDAVSGAEEYVVIMIDPDGNNWVHWIQSGITGTSLEEGQASDAQYKGPYPPSGTHHYEVHVYALASAPSSIDASFDAGGNDLDKIFSSLDNNSQNVLSQDAVTGTYTAGD